MANPNLCSFALFILFFINSSFAQASLEPITDPKYSSDKNNCYNDIDSGLWGENCRASRMDRENCALRCLSPLCYELIYQNDPLEEGERDHIRSQEYRYCMRRVRGNGDRLVVYNMGDFFTVLQDHQMD